MKKFNILDLMVVVWTVALAFTKYSEPSLDSEGYMIYLTQMNHYYTLVFISITGSILLDTIKKGE